MGAAAWDVFSGSFHFKVIKLYLVPFLQIGKARRERKTLNPSTFLLFPDQGKRSE